MFRERKGQSPAKRLGRVRLGNTRRCRLSPTTRAFTPVFGRLQQPDERESLRKCKKVISMEPIGVSIPCRVGNAVALTRPSMPGSVPAVEQVLIWERYLSNSTEADERIPATPKISPSSQ